MQLALRSTTGAVKVVATLAAAAVIGFGIPAFWLWVAGLVQSASDNQGLAFGAVMVAIGGVVASYIALIATVGWFGARFGRGDEDAAPRRYSWNRSMRDARKQAPTLSPLETVFVVTALLVGAAYMVWFFFFAGSSLPGGG